MSVLSLVERDCLGVTSAYPQQIHVDVLDAAERVMNRMLFSIANAEAPKHIGAGTAPFVPSSLGGASSSSSSSSATTSSSTSSTSGSNAVAAGASPSHHHAHQFHPPEELRGIFALAAGGLTANSSGNTQQFVFDLVGGSVLGEEEVGEDWEEAANAWLPTPPALQQQRPTVGSEGKQGGSAKRVPRSYSSSKQGNHTHTTSTSEKTMTSIFIDSDLNEQSGNPSLTQTQNKLESSDMSFFGGPQNQQQAEQDGEFLAGDGEDNDDDDGFVADEDDMDFGASP